LVGWFGWLVWLVDLVGWFGWFGWLVGWLVGYNSWGWWASNMLLERPVEVMFPKLTEISVRPFVTPVAILGVILLVQTSRDQTWKLELPVLFVGMPEMWNDSCLWRCVHHYTSTTVR
jgi:hypothetical protein